MKVRIIATLLGILCGSAHLCAQVSFDTSEAGQTGEKVLGSYFSTDIDSVSMMNGNLHLSIPLFNLPGRELPLRLNWDYNSRFVEMRTIYPEVGDPFSVWEFLGWRKDTGIGGTLTAMKSRVSYASTWVIYDLTFYWIDGMGSKTTFTKQVTQNCSSGYVYASDQCMGPNPVTPYDSQTVDTSIPAVFGSRPANIFRSMAIPACPPRLRRKTASRLFSRKATSGPSSRQTGTNLRF